LEVAPILRCPRNFRSKKLTYAYSVGFVFGAMLLSILNRLVASIIGTLLAILFVFAAFYVGLW
jgi:hypothetical protein